MLVADKAVVHTANSRPRDHRDELQPSYAAARGLPLRGSNAEQQVPAVAREQSRLRRDEGGPSLLGAKGAV